MCLPHPHFQIWIFNENLIKFQENDEFENSEIYSIDTIFASKPQIKFNIFPFSLGHADHVRR